MRLPKVLGAAVPVSAPVDGDLTFPVLTETKRTFRLTGPAIEAGTVATTATEITQVGYDGVLYLEQPRPGQAVEVEGVCKATLSRDLGSAQAVAEVACH